MPVGERGLTRQLDKNFSRGSWFCVAVPLSNAPRLRGVEALAYVPSFNFLV
nr:MAG TPA: hypothetical protein [Caudoviricetes sp.]